MKNEPSPSSEEMDRGVQDSIESLRRYVKSYQALLKQQAVWLLLATLGCWGVSAKPLQWMAFGIVLLVFVDRMHEKTRDQQSISKSFSLLKERILRDLSPGDTQKARLWDLEDLQKTEMGSKVILKRNFLFLICWLFYGFSFLASASGFQGA